LKWCIKFFPLCTTPLPGADSGVAAAAGRSIEAGEVAAVVKSTSSRSMLVVVVVVVGVGVVVVVE
jgi:hypothetical protein